MLTLKFGGRGHDGESDRRKRIVCAAGSSWLVANTDLQEIAPLLEPSSRFCWLVAKPCLARWTDQDGRSGPLIAPPTDISTWEHWGCRACHRVPWESSEFTVIATTLRGGAGSNTEGRSEDRK